MSGHTPGQSEVQPESLRIAKALDEDQFRLDDLDIEAADELRRLHAMNTELLEALREIVGQHGQWNNGMWAANIASAAIAKATGLHHDPPPTFPPWTLAWQVTRCDVYCICAG